MTQGEHRPNPEEAQPAPDAAAETPHTAHGAPEVVGLHDETFGVGGVLTAQLVEAQSKLAEMQDAYLRAKAEADNTRRRAQEDIAKAHKFAIESFAESLLPVKDSLDLAIESAGRADAAALIEGQAATQRLLAKALERVGITEINPVGQPFDADQHEAMAAQPSETAEPNSVLAVVQRGYLLNGRLLRAARVIVSRAPG